MRIDLGIDRLIRQDSGLHYTTVIIYSEGVEYTGANMRKLYVILIVFF